MKFKPTLVALSLAGSTLFFASYTVLKTAGSHPGSTGAPGESTCAQNGCHSDAQIGVNTPGVNTLLFSASDSVYIPGQTYTLTLQVNSSHTSKFGFELVALRDLNITNTGTIGILDPLRTQITNHTVGNDIRQCITHETAGTPSLSPGFTEWKMKWAAPSTDVGTITFYYATNCTNDDGMETGDNIYLSSFRIKPPVTTNAVKNSLASDLEINVNAFFNRDSREIILNYSIPKPTHVKTRVSDYAGASIFENRSSLRSGEQIEKINLPANYTKGTYVIQLILDNRAISKKIIVD
jgi:hypothetical protein